MNLCIARLLRASCSGPVTSGLRALFVICVLATSILPQEKILPPKNHQPCSFDALLSKADEFRAIWRRDALESAIREYEQILSCNQSPESAPARARALQAIGNIRDTWGERELAADYYKRALRLYQSLGDRNREIHTLIDLCFAYSRSKTPKRAIEHGLRAVAIARELTDKRAEALALNGLGFAYYALGDSAAEGYYFKALDADNYSSDPATRAHILLNLGYINTDRGNLTEALSNQQHAASLSETAHRPWVRARALSGSGAIFTLLGEKQKALDSHHAALELQRAMGDREGEAVTLNGVGYSYQQLGENQKALTAYSQALERFRATGNLEGEAFTVQYVGNMHERVGSSALAEQCYLEGLALSRKLQDDHAVAYALNSLGLLYQSNGRHREAIERHELALSIYEKLGIKRGAAYTLDNLGSAFVASKPDIALQYYSRALTLIRSSADRHQESAILYHLADVHDRLNRLEEAGRYLTEAIDIGESLRASVVSQDFRATYFSLTRGYYERLTDVLMRLHAEHPGDHYDEKAFEVSERARARGLLESLREARANISANVDPKLLEEERLLTRRLSVVAERHMRLVEAQADAAEAEKEINQIENQYDQLKTKIKTANPRYALLIQPQPLTLKQIQQQVLDGNSVLLEYMLGDERSYVWAVTRTEITSHELPPRAQIEAAARTLREALTANQRVANESFAQQQTRMREAEARYPEAAAALNDMLIGPVQHTLGTKRLIIVADGALHYIPFQALTVSTDANDASRVAERVPLFVNNEIVYEPSASTLALVVNEAPGRDAPKSVAVFAHPVFEADDPRVHSPTNISDASDQQVIVRGVFRDLGFSDGRVPALPASRDEAEAIISYAPWGTGLKALGFEASRATVTSPELAQYRIVHFATHGYVDYERPDLSGLVLSLVDRHGQPQEGHLRLHDIYNLKLSANLVVLSACNTGLGKEIKGEGLIGLTRGFMYAGADTVAASLWKVDDEATAELMKEFYKGMFRDNLTPAAALRQAQIAMWNQPRWRAPYFWAAFIIQGRYDQTEIATASNSRAQWLVTSAGLLSVCLLAACFVFGRRRSRTL